MSNHANTGQPLNSAQVAHYGNLVGDVEAPVKDRGYAVYALVSPGDEVAIPAGTHLGHGERLDAPEVATVVEFTNAGFRGIEATVRLAAAGTRLRGIPAGVLVPR